ncbi:sensor histidine kinase [Streptomyces actinomycinicus]|uniref:histidine kinase n=1 Tax=Streptomyces actinomycinicus TaxID=1695166 RepID=A0A937EP78_9ACTN|nr:DUF4118 domain-containing protein [Streptomyces actinomycinicus]MBL1086977.1 sensor histidine kinase [Streptomyces actinomycinicus]
MEVLSRHWLNGLLTGTAMVAAVTGLLDALDPYVLHLHLLALYMLPVMIVAVAWGAALAVLTSVLSVVAYVYLFARPHGFPVAQSQTSAALAAFLLTAALVGHLAARLRHSALVLARLSQEQSALREVATLIARSARPSTVFDAVTREAGLLTDADAVRVERYETHGGRRRVAAWRADDDVGGAGGATAPETGVPEPGSSVECPIIVAGQPWGLIVASKHGDAPFAANAESQITAFTDLVCIAIENAKAHAELTASRARIVTAADYARRRIERDLHDGVQQRLVSLLLLLRNAQTSVPADLYRLRTELDVVAAGLTDACEELREVARGIHPAILAQGGLVPALKALARRSAVPVALETDVRERLPERVEVSAYYVVSEALTNAAKHAEASTVTVTAAAGSGLLHVRIQDDGVGGASFAAGTGLVGLRDRVEALDGKLFLDSPPAAGTTLRAELPFAGTDRAGHDQAPSAGRRAAAPPAQTPHQASRGRHTGRPLG